ncbi:hypothetical protein KOI40_00515 [Aestuariicella sp. G3-2]|uniref:hypothetical protein n=1 Tax=Pseudomaricurvus albidus TaxID=2842452 RepID=UPI001C0CFB6F|nr:hypothetical protein [Aestuariicella albida]MBU3068275.1 hypothetical protein [Aestuariicella albida]
MKKIISKRWLAGIFIFSIMFLCFRNHIFNPGFSRVFFEVSGEKRFEMMIPNEIIYPKSKAPMYGSVDSVYLDISSGKRFGNSPRYTLKISANVDDNAIVRTSIADTLSKMTEVTSNFKGYRKYILDIQGEAAFFYLIKESEDHQPIYFKCYQGSSGIGGIKKCRYFGVYNSYISYELSFPGEELNEIDGLINLTISKISELLIKD